MVSCKQSSMQGMIIVTQRLVDTKDKNFQIIAVDPHNSVNINNLTGSFITACSPVISFDGKKMLFTAIEKEGDPWQIWEMNLSAAKSRKVLSSEENCIDPGYLPDGRIFFSRQTGIINNIMEYSLFTGKADGTDLRQITWNPHNNSVSSVLMDGRILTVSRSVYPETGDPAFFALRPDGTKDELFYKGIPGSSIVSHGNETADGKIVFIEAGSGKTDNNQIVSVSYNRPLHSRNNLSSGLKGSFNTVLPLKTGKYLVSWRPSESSRYALYEFDPSTGESGKIIYQNADFDVLDATIAEARDLPKKLPSEVDPGSKTGLLLCQNINFTGTGSSPDARATGLRVMGSDSTLGEVQVEEDGSFYLKVKADMPFRMQSISDDGKVIRECKWIYLRPNERRGCVGCHEDNEMVPENRYCMSVSKKPVEIPNHVRNLQEKKIELE